MNIRKYTKDDNHEIYNLFYDSVHSIKRKIYTKKQLDEWAKKLTDIENWCKKFTDSYTLVAEENGKIIGFSNITKDGYIETLYVHTNHQHKKVATNLLSDIEKYSIDNNLSQILTYSSKNAKAFFEKSGYSVSEENILIRGKEELKNYLMKKER